MTKEVKQEQDEPVCDKDPRGCWSISCQLDKKCKNTPQTKEWVGLTEYEIKGVLGLSESWVGEDCSIPDMIGFAKAIEAKLKEKNET